MIVYANLIVQHVIEVKNGIIRQVNVNLKIIVSAKKITAWVLAQARIATFDDWKAKYDEIIYVMDIVSTKTTNALPENVTSTMLTNCDDKKVIYKLNCYIPHIIFLMILLPLIITIICYHYAQQKDIDALTV